VKGSAKAELFLLEYAIAFFAYLDLRLLTFVF